MCVSMVSAASERGALGQGTTALAASPLNGYHTETTTEPVHTVRQGVLRGGRTLRSTDAALCWPDVIAPKSLPASFLGAD